MLRVGKGDKGDDVSSEMPRDVTSALPLRLNERACAWSHADVCGAIVQAAVAKVEADNLRLSQARRAVTPTMTC